MRWTIPAGAFALLLAACAGGKDASDATGATGTTSSAGSTSEGSGSTSGNEVTSTSTEATSTSGSASTTGSPSTSSSSTTDATSTTGGDACDPFKQDCPPGEKCTAWAPDGSPDPYANKCLPVDPNPKQAGESCEAAGKGTGIDDCDVGMYCWYSAFWEAGYCVEFCKGSDEDPECPDGTFCEIPADAVMPLCRPTCEPLMPGDCPENQTCVQAATETFLCKWLSGLGGDGEACDSLTSCLSGICKDSDSLPMCGSGQCCTSYCDLNEPNTCPQADLGAECVSLFGFEPPPGKENIGFCGIPK